MLNPAGYKLENMKFSLLTKCPAYLKMEHKADPKEPKLQTSQAN